MGSTRVDFRLPETLIEKADAAAEIRHTDRTEILKRALDEYFTTIEDDERFKQALVDQYLDDELRFEVLAEFIGRRDAESVRASKELLERGGELASDLAER